MNIETAFLPAASPVSPKTPNDQALAPRERNSAKQTIEREKVIMTKDLQGSAPAVTPALVKRHRKGWTPERRARQAALIRGWAPWRNSTGPRTHAGKARCAKNALRHGFSSRATLDQLRRVNRALHLAARNIRFLNLLVRFRRWLRLLRAIREREPANAGKHERRSDHADDRQRFAQDRDGKHQSRHRTQDSDRRIRMRGDAVQRGIHEERRQHGRGHGEQKRIAQKRPAHEELS